MSRHPMLRLFSRSCFVLIWLLALTTLGSCALVTVPVKVAGKVATTSIGLVGKAAGAGIDAMVSDDDDDNDEDDKDDDA